MTQKVKFELEYLLKTSPKILENMLCTPSGLSEWFAEDVNVKDDIFTFCWDGSEEKARLVNKKPSARAKFKWLEDENEGNDYFFEMSFEIDPMTKVIIMTVTDFAEEDEVEEAQMLWESQVNDLKRLIGA